MPSTPTSSFDRSRPIATRAGLSDATLHCSRLLELAGYDPVLIETVGVGQNEVDIGSVADLCVVVLGPGYGDDIQLIKAGLLEIAHVVVVNKCDLPESDRLLQEVREELAGAARAGAGDVEILGVEAKSGRGVDELLQRLIELDRPHRTAAAQASRGERRVLGEIRRRAMFACTGAMQRVLNDTAAKQWIAQLSRGESSLDAVLSRLAAAALADVKQQEGAEEVRHG